MGLPPTGQRSSRDTAIQTPATVLEGSTRKKERRTRREETKNPNNFTITLHNLRVNPYMISPLCVYNIRCKAIVSCI